MQRTIIFVLSLTSFTIGLSQQRNCHDCRVAFMRDRIYKPALDAYVTPEGGKDTKYLFYDSAIIAEWHALSMTKDAEGRDTWRRWVFGYAFLDVRTKCFYRYRHFSDTARIIEATRHIEKGPEVDDWNFFGKPRIPHALLPLEDTVLKGEKCHRLKVFYIDKGDTVLTEIMYYVNATERPLIGLGRTVVNGQQFSIIREDDFDATTKLKTYSVMDIVSHELTKKELKVFAAWKRNVRKYPIPRNPKGVYVLGSKGSLVLQKKSQWNWRQQ